MDDGGEAGGDYLESLGKTDLALLDRGGVGHASSR